MVARAWVDPAYRQRLLDRGSEAIGELGFSGVQGEDMVVVENTDQVHNLVVCTLCSCYPWPTLGLPPVWYKSAPYRSRAVSDPRGVLEEFGVERAGRAPRSGSGTATPSCAIWFCPSGQPAPRACPRTSSRRLVTRDSMIGVGLPRSPNG